MSPRPGRVRRGGARRITLALLAAAPTLALAQVTAGATPAAASRGYLSLGAGASAHGTDCGGSRDCDRVGSAVRGAAGWLFSPEVGVELAAVDFGRSRVRDRGSEVDLRVRLLGVGLVVPLEPGARFNGLLRLGVGSVTVRREPLPPTLAPSARSRGVEGYYGLTLGYQLLPQLALELSFDGTRADTGGNVSRVDALTLGASLRF